MSKFKSLPVITKTDNICIFYIYNSCSSASALLHKTQNRTLLEQNNDTQNKTEKYNEIFQ
jgi:hypothetical protein